MSRRRPQPRGPTPRRSTARTPAGERKSVAAPSTPPATGRRQRPAARRASTATPTGLRSWWPVAGVTAVMVASVGLVIALFVISHSSPSTSTTATLPPGAPPVLAPISTAITGQAVDDIQCQGSEQVLFHIHAHLAIYVNSSARTIPEGIGIMPPRQEESSNGAPFVVGGSCYYWLHAHTADGIIHIESPVQRTYTLGNYFDIWGVPLDATHVGPASGTVIAYVDGQVYNGDLRSIPLTAHTLVQLDVNGNVPAASFTFPVGD